VSDAEDPRPALFDRAIVAFNKRDMAALDRVVAEDISSHVSPDMANSGSWEDRQGFYAMLIGWTEPWSELKIEVKGYELLDSQRMLAHIHQKAVGAGSGVPVELDVCFGVEIETADGMRMVRFEVHPNRESALSHLGWTAPD
jgi:hypothetical protein